MPRNTHKVARNIASVITEIGIDSRILRKLLELITAPFERSVLIKGSCTICTQAALYDFHGL